MTRILAAALISLIALPFVSGCAERAIKEASGAALGAEAKVVAPPAKADEPSLAAYKTIQIQEITASPDLSAPADLADVVKAKWTTALTEAEVTATESPNAIVKAEIVHYEGASLVDAASGPFTQIIVRATIIDAATQKPIRSANLVGRATSIAAGTPDGLATGSSKALLQWLGDNGVPVKNTTGTLTRTASNPATALTSSATSVAGALPGASAITGANSGTGALSIAAAGAAIPTSIPNTEAIPRSTIAAPSMSAGPSPGATPAIPNAAMPGQTALSAGGALQGAAIPSASSMSSAVPEMLVQDPAALSGSILTLPIDSAPIAGTAAAGNTLPNSINGATIPTMPSIGGIANQAAPATALPGSVEQILPESISPIAPGIGAALSSAPIPASLSKATKLASEPSVLVESLPAIPKPPAITPVQQPPAPPPIQEVPANN